MTLNFCDAVCKLVEYTGSKPQGINLKNGLKNHMSMVKDCSIAMLFFQI